MLRHSVTLFRQNEAKDNLKFLPQVRLQNTYVNLDIRLSKMANESQRFNYHSRSKINRNHLLFSYVDVLKRYLLIANLKNWNQLVLISDDEIDALSHKKQASLDDINKLYLAIKNMLFNSYFDRRQNDFIYSWKLFLKFGLSDLKFSVQEIEQEFNNQVTQKIN